MRRKTLTIAVVDENVERFFDEIKKRKNALKVRSLSVAAGIILSNLVKNQMIDDLLLYNREETELSKEL